MNSWGWGVAKDFAARWQAHHGGVSIDANAWVRGWLALVMRPTALLVRLRVSPSMLTLIGFGLSLATIWVSAQGLARIGLFGCAVLVVASAYFDGLDGAVAILRDRVTDFGSRLDRVSDRLSELAWLVMFVIFGTPIWLAAAALVASWAYEWSRWRASAKGQLGVGVITVAERPVRVAIVVMFLLAAMLFVGWAQWWLVAGLVAWAAVCLVGACQVSRGF